MAARIFPVILAGGTGSRLWPLSSAHCPKPFIRLFGDHTMLQETALRVAVPGWAPPVIVCNHECRFIAAENLRGVGLTPHAILLEAEARGTACAAAVAALCVAEADPGALVIILPSDHVIDDSKKFYESVMSAQAAALDGALVLFGVAPRGPETGYGYIKTGTGPGPVLHVESFIEKPDAATAGALIRQGALWNAGIFMFRADAILRSILMHAPGVHRAALQIWAARRPDLDFTRMGEPPADCPHISIDRAVMEKDKGLSAVELRAAWSDLGTWDAVHGYAASDAQGNSAQGDSVLIDTRDSLVLAAEGISVATLGLERVAVIAGEDAVLVASLQRAQDVTSIVAKLESRGQSRCREPRQVSRPWGHYRVLGQGQGYIIKRLVVRPAAALSLQYHNHRAEHWVIIKGAVRVVRGEESMALGVGESVYIPAGMRHSIANNGPGPAELIEIQTGDILSEEDIVRLEDPYKRA